MKLGNRVTRWVVILGLSLGSAKIWSAPAVSSRYVGVIRNDGIQRDQLAKLDLIASREEGNTLYLKAVLTLHFGDFANKEYVAYHFDDVRFNILNRSFVFDQPDQPVTLVVTQSSGNRFEGEFRSAYSGHQGKVLLSSDQAIVPIYPLIEPVWGEYRGLCDSKISFQKTMTSLQLYTYRAEGGAGEVGNPFRAYKIKGFVGENTGDYCERGDSGLCVWGNIRTGAFNFFKNQLQIFSNYKNLVCTPESDGLQCNGCGLMKRVSGEMSVGRVMSPLVSSNVFGSVKPEASALTDEIHSIQGEYTGYLHHEFLNQYQPGSVNILTYQIAPTPGAPATLRMSALASLHFGAGPEIETISYRFNEKSYPNPLLAPQFVFSQPDSDVDAMLQVTSLGKGVVKGIWFSRVFGRVGEFEFYKSGAPQLASDAIKFKGISGYFKGPQWEMSLLVALGVSAPGSQNPFAPLSFGGYAIAPLITPKKHITGGTYDFYTGRIGMELGQDVAFIGERTLESDLLLRKVQGAVVSPLPSFGLQPFHRKNEVSP